PFPQDALRTVKAWQKERIKILKTVVCLSVLPAAQRMLSRQQKEGRNLGFDVNPVPPQPIDIGASSQCSSTKHIRCSSTSLICNLKARSQRLRCYRRSFPFGYGRVQERHWLLDGSHQ